jgi:protein phosphatase
MPDSDNGTTDNSNSGTASQDVIRPTVGVSSSRGNRDFNCDTAADYWFPANGVLTAAVVDGTGNSLEVAHIAFLAAHAAVRVGARKGAVPGLLAATELIADPTVEFPKPDGVMVLAVCRPRQPTVIVHVGDCAAFAYDERDNVGLCRLTEDHTKGQRMRLHGHPEDEAAKRDRIITNSIGRATIGAITLTETSAHTVVLVSDGVHRALSIEDMKAILREHHTEPATCAGLLVDAARSAGSGDDATALVLTHPVPPVADAGSWGR